MLCFDATGVKCRRYSTRSLPLPAVQTTVSHSQLYINKPAHNFLSRHTPDPTHPPTHPQTDTQTQEPSCKRAVWCHLMLRTTDGGHLPWVCAEQRRWRRPPPRPPRCHSPHPPCASRLSPPGHTLRTGAPLATLCCSTARCCSCAALLHLQMAHSYCR